MPELADNFAGGVVTARDRAHLEPGELQEGTGGYYEPGDPVGFHKLGGRSTFDEAEASQKIKGVAIAQFDAGGTDLLIAFANTTLYKATPGLTGTFASLAGSITGDTLSAAHADNRWYLATGDMNRVVESDATARTMGLVSPREAPTLALVASGTVVECPGTGGAGFIDNASAYDDNNSTFASATLDTVGGSDIFTCSFADVALGTSPNIDVLWSVIIGGGGEAGEGGEAEQVECTVKLEYSENSGSDWSTFLEWTIRTSTPGQFVTAQSPELTAVASFQRFRATFTLVSGAGAVVTLRVHEVQIRSHGQGALTESAEHGILYAIAEWDEGTGLPPSPHHGHSEDSDIPSTIPTTAHAGVEVSWSSVVQRNTRSTHWMIYRTADGGTASQLGELARVPISESRFYDDFSKFGVNVQPLPLEESLTIPGTDGGSILIPKHQAPPSFRRLRFYSGHMIGLSDNNPRSLYYSVSGLAESWPSIYIITDFPLPEHDELVDCIEVGGSLVVAARAAMLRMDGLPLSVSGVFQGRVQQIAGAPGCVGDYALTAVSMDGEQGAAWIGYHGLYVTNGHTYRRISNDVDWEDFRDQDMSGFVLAWDQRFKYLVMAYASVDGGGNDRYALIHLDQAHKKGDQPKWTYPHYGAISHMASAQVGNTYRRYSGHVSDGKVYLENNAATGADASNAYDSNGTHRLRVKSGRRYDGWRDWRVHDGRLRHSDFGSGEEATLAYTVGRDTSGESEAKNIAVSLAGQKATRLEVGRGGEYHEYTLTHDGTGLGTLYELLLNADRGGKSGGP